MAQDLKMKPKCMNGTIQAAVTNRGHLIPCCYCDEDWALRTPQLKRIVEVSKISEHDTIEDILFSKPWLDFEENLRTNNINEIPKICIDHCKDRGEDKIKKETYYHKGKKTGEEIM